LLHEAGVIHRDIKPENLILSRTGAKLTDFGIARVPDSTLTGAGNVLGTPAYSSPEAIRSSQFSPRSDQFSLAATLYEALSGRRAFPGDDAVFVATQIANTAPHPIAQLCGVPIAADAVLLRALSKNPLQRFDDCEQFGAALAEALVPTPRTTQPPVPVVLRDLPEPAPRRSRVGGLFSALVLLGIGAWLGTRLFTPNLSDSPAAQPVLPLSAQVEKEVPAVAWLFERRRQPGKEEKEEDEEPAEDATEEAEPEPESRAGNTGATGNTSTTGNGGAATKPVGGAPAKSATGARKSPKSHTAKAPRVPSQAP
jgi:serine/threonine-protein kinase